MNDKEREQLVEDAAAALVLAGMTGADAERDDLEKAYERHRGRQEPEAER